MARRMASVGLVSVSEKRSIISTRTKQFSKNQESGLSYASRARGRILSGRKWACASVSLQSSILTFVLPCRSFAQPSASAHKPNFLYIVADDLGWKDVGFHGSDIKTPNIDQLAAAGARLEQFYAQPMCTPTRAALMTGRYPFRYGLQTLVIPSDRTPTACRPTNGLLPQALKDAGYQTAIIGKWHLGHADRKYWPRQRGFDYQYGPLIGEMDYFTHEAARRAGLVSRTTNRSKEKGYTTTLLGNDAVKLHRRRTTQRSRSSSTWPSTPRTRRTRRRRNISTDTRTSPIRAAAPMRPASPPWTTRSAG